MEITPAIAYNVLRVYGSQLVADRNKRKKIWIKKKKKKDRKCGCVRSAPRKGIIDIYT